MELIVSKERNAFSKSRFRDPLTLPLEWNITALTLIEISVFLHAIFPSIAQIPDRMGPKSALTSAGMMCFFIYW
jgi:hypothetical protein